MCPRTDIIKKVNFSDKFVIFQPTEGDISQVFLFFSQTADISANSDSFSAKLLIYQPNSIPFQPNYSYISQLRSLFSQTTHISAKLDPFSAKLLLYQPNSIPFQPNSIPFQPNYSYISQTRSFSAKLLLYQPIPPSKTKIHRTIGNGLTQLSIFPKIRHPSFVQINLFSFYLTAF